MMESVNVTVDDEPSKKEETNMNEDDDGADVPADAPTTVLGNDSETSSGKNDSVKAKIERTAKGVKCMGLKSGSSQPPPVPKKASGKPKTRNPTRKTYMSKVQNKEPTSVPRYEDATDEEEINDEDSPVKSSPVDVHDVETSVSQETPDQENPEKDSTSHEDSGNATQPDVSESSSSKDADPKNDSSEDPNSEESIQAPASVQDISDGDSGDVPLTASFPDSVAARLTRKRRVPDTETTPAPQKRSKSSPVTYKSRQADVKGKGKQKAVKTPSEKKKKKCYEKLVREFLVKLSVDVGLPESDEFRKVFVRAECVVFSPAVISQALGRSVIEFADEEVSLEAIAKELTTGHVKKWPHKKLLSTGNLNVKYAILNRIGAVNWVPTQHISGVSATLAKLIYKIGKSITFDFGAFDFEQTLKHVDTCVVRLPVSFPSLLTAIILKQHPQILRADEVAMSPGVSITLDKHLFMEPHVLDIALATSTTSAPPVTESGAHAIIAELHETSSRQWLCYVHVVFKLLLVFFWLAYVQAAATVE
ncbi:uncharacterized protein LOC130733294 [Lotus japonicus]|uniref:uncharacterized protein LOC130733294 n=1 Tax=Lotus japonicus TaxID=34305 RepID=UPI002588B114|nr:uncharacterized protein LOC130733294 [Lotus japonicus]